MSDTQMQQFDARLRRIGRRHQKLAQGVVISVNKDGLMLAKPAQERFRMPWRGIMMILALMLAYKSLLFAHIGPIDYTQRVEALAAGTAIEQFGAWVMTPDPVTQFLAAFFTGVTF